MATRRKNLSGRFEYGTASIDMEEVYHKIDSGSTVAEVAMELGVHRSTLYRKHKIYQSQLELLEQLKKEEEMESIPPIPRIPQEAL